MPAGGPSPGLVPEEVARRQLQEEVTAQRPICVARADSISPTASPIKSRMSTSPLTVVVEPDEDAFHATVPAFPGCHTFGMTVDEAYANIAEAMKLHVEGMPEDGEPIPVEGESLFITRLSVPAAACAPSFHEWTVGNGSGR